MAVRHPGHVVSLEDNPLSGKQEL